MPYRVGPRHDAIGMPLVFLVQASLMLTVGRARLRMAQLDKAIGIAQDAFAMLKKDPFHNKEDLRGQGAVLINEPGSALFSRLHEIATKWPCGKR